jgi:release factor glutamine methyltransferase
VTPGTIGELVARLRRELAGRDDSAALEAELLVAAALACERAQLVARWNDVVLPETEAAAAALLARRLRDEPIALILGAREFHGRRFALTPGVLVPRPETEHLVDVALAAIDGRERATDARTAATTGWWADVGTGSGAIAVTLALERPALRVLALDLAPAAVACARQNAAALGATGRVTVVRGDLLAAIAARGALAGIVANPPYVEPLEWPRLSPEVQKFEPVLALTPWVESAASFRARLIAQAGERLADGGFLAIEVGAGQAGTARDQLLDARFRDVAITNDLAGIGRVVSGRLRRAAAGRGPTTTGAPSA